MKFRWLWLPLWRFSSQRTKEWKRSRAAESTKPIMTLAIRQRRRNECVPCSRSQRERLSSRRGNDNDAARWIFVITNSSSMPGHGDAAGRRVMEAATPVGQSRFQCRSLCLSLWRANCKSMTSVAFAPLHWPFVGDETVHGPEESL